MHGGIPFPMVWLRLTGPRAWEGDKGPVRSRLERDMAGKEAVGLGMHFKERNTGLSLMGIHLWGITQSGAVSRARLGR